MPKQTKTTAETQTESLNVTDDVAACAPQSDRRRFEETLDPGRQPLKLTNFPG